VRRYAAACIVVLVALVVVTVLYAKEISLTYSLYRYEGGLAALSNAPHSAHFVGTVAPVPPRSDFFLVAEGGGVGAVAQLHSNGCFALRGGGSFTNLRIHAAGFSQASPVSVESGYFYVDLAPTPLGRGNASRLTLTRISWWDFVKRTVACTSSSI
jgi:hypothetical protein